MDIPDSSNLILDFIATASSVAGTYNNTASASTTQFGVIESNPAQVQVDAARISLTKTPSTYLVNPGDPVTYTLTYSNDSSVTVTDANITDTLPRITSYNVCYTKLLRVHLTINLLMFLFASFHDSYLLR